MASWKKLFALLLLCVILLTSCGTQPRILTELTPGEHVPYVELSDGYLYFISTSTDVVPAWGFSAPAMSQQNNPSKVMISYNGYMDPTTYDEAVAEMGFSPSEATAHLPEHLQIGKAAFEGNMVGRANYANTDIPTDILVGGFSFSRDEDDYPHGLAWPYVSLKLTIQEEGGSMDSFGTGSFRVFPWVRTNRSRDAYFNDDYFAHYRPSQVGDITVGAMHVYHHITNDIFVGYWTMYYAGWYVNDVAFVLECTNGYCTQEEFIQLLLALIDGAIAQDTHWQGRQAALSGA